MRPAVPAALVMLAIAAAHPAGAHAFLDHADPTVGGTVGVSPTMIRLWFSEAIEPAFSKVALAGADGTAIAAGPASVASADRSELDLPLSAPLAAGSYTVTWRVVAADTHRTQGHFTFEVKP